MPPATRPGNGPARPRYPFLRPACLLVATLVALGAGTLVWWPGWLANAPESTVLLPDRSAAAQVPPAAPVPLVPIVEPVEPAAPPSPPAEPAPIVEAPAAPPKRSAAATPARHRFAVELEPLFTGPDAERVERQLNQAGYQTVRFRREVTGAAVYAVVVDRVAAADAQAVVAALRDLGFVDVGIQGAGDALSVRVSTPLPLRGAVLLAQRLRTGGHHVRIAKETGTAVFFVVRHGNFASRREAETTGRALEGLGLPNQTVQVR
jgi:hypothetical protein